MGNPKIDQEHPTISIIIPIYNEEDNLDKLFGRLKQALSDLIFPYELVCINDGSKDRSLEMLIAKREVQPEIKVINLSRNFGKEIALTAGIDYASGDAVIPIDADLQDPPELINELVDKWQQGFDVVYACRRSRQGESWLKRLTAGAFYQFIAKIANIPIPQNTGDFRLMDRRVVEAIKQMPERTRFMKGIFIWVGFRQTPVYFDRQARLAGKTTWNYWKLWNFALDGITSFSNFPLKIWSYFGLVIAFVAFLYALYLVLRTIFLGVDVPGYASLMTCVLFLGGINLITLGIIGEYLGRIFQEVKQRPLYLVRDSYGFSKQTSGSESCSSDKTEALE